MQMMTPVQTAKSVKSKGVNKIYRGPDAVKYIIPFVRTGIFSEGEKSGD